MTRETWPVAGRLGLEGESLELKQLKRGPCPGTLCLLESSSLRSAKCRIRQCLHAAAAAAQTQTGCAIREAEALKLGLTV